MPDVHTPATGTGVGLGWDVVAVVVGGHFRVDHCGHDGTSDRCGSVASIAVARRCLAVERHGEQTGEAAVVVADQVEAIAVLDDLTVVEHHDLVDGAQRATVGGR